MIIIILGAIYLLVKIFNLKEGNSSPFPREKILSIIPLSFLLYFVINILLSDGIKYLCCFPESNKCFTVWKRSNGDKYIILGEHDKRRLPLDNYVQLINYPCDNVHIILSKEDKMIISCQCQGSHAKIVLKSSNESIELYHDNKAQNDTTYRYYDGKHWLYKDGVNRISVNVDENYATDNKGNRIEKSKWFFYW